jgi:hypothetical protein
MRLIGPRWMIRNLAWGALDASDGNGLHSGV